MNIDKLGRILNYAIGITGIYLAIKSWMMCFCSHKEEPMLIVNYSLLYAAIAAGCVLLIRMTNKEKRKQKHNH